MTLTRLRRDTNRYSTLTLSADGRTLATRPKKTLRRIFTFSLLRVTTLAWLNHFFHSANDIFTFNWTADGNLLATDSGRLLKIGIDGKNQTQLLADSSAVHNQSVCLWRELFRICLGLSRQHALGEHLAHQHRWFPSAEVDRWKRGLHIPVCSPNQKWVYYYDLSHGSMLACASWTVLVSRT